VSASYLSIERKVPLGLGALLLLVTSALSLTAYLTVRQGAETGAEEALRAALRTVSGLLADDVRRVGAAARDFATDPRLGAVVTAEVEPDSDPALDPRHTAALARLQERLADPRVVAIELWEEAGARRLAAGAGAAAVAESTAAAGGFDPSRVQGVVGPLRSAAGKVVLPVVVPLTSGGQRVGHLVEWREIVFDIPLTNTRFLLGNRDDALWTDGTAVVPAPPVELVGNGQILRYERPGTGNRFATAVPIAGTPWLGLVEMPAEAVLRPARLFLGRMLAIAGVLFSVSLIVAAVWSRRLTRPLGELARAADAIAAGDLSSRVAVRRKDELGRLSRAFNRMTDRLADSKEQLERRLVELRRAQEQFTRAQRMEVVGLLAGGVAHDFNNLLTIILGETELALADLAPDDPARAPLLEIAAAGERATALTRQLLVFSRGQVIEPDVFDLDAVLEDSVRMLQRLIRDRVQVVVRAARHSLPVRADRGQVEQVVMNLVVNARDAMPNGGRIYLETQRVTFDEAAARVQGDLRAGEYAALVVSDTGVGMNEEVKARLFEPFFTTKQPGKGTGLGLPACRGIVERWGGHIAIYSEPDVGTTVKAYFPLVADELVGEEPRAAAVAGGGETVLLVDDEPAVRELAARILRAHGYGVLEAPDAATALGLLAAHESVELLITDVVLPGTSGRELADQAFDLRPDLRVLFMSGYTEDVILQRRLLERDVALLQKPFTAERLARRTREALDGRPAA
jgi:signal transduction histidine kinase